MYPSRNTVVRRRPPRFAGGRIGSIRGELRIRQIACIALARALILTAGEIGQVRELLELWV